MLQSIRVVKHKVTFKGSLCEGKRTATRVFNTPRSMVMTTQCDEVSRQSISLSVSCVRCSEVSVADLITHVFQGWGVLLVCVMKSMGKGSAITLRSLTHSLCA